MFMFRNIWAKPLQQVVCKEDPNLQDIYKELNQLHNVSQQEFDEAFAQCKSQVGGEILRTIQQERRRIGSQMLKEVEEQQKYTPY